MYNSSSIECIDCDRATLQTEDFVTINVSGIIYETLHSTLRRFPDTLLGNKRKRQMYFVKSRNTYFFNRCRQCFEAILYYYQNGGILAKPVDISMLDFQKEVLFFELGDDVLRQLQLDERFVVENNEEENAYSTSIDSNGNWQGKVWNLFEHPDSSTMARCVSVLSMLVISFSLTVFCLETIYFKEEYPSSTQNTKFAMNLHYNNRTISNTTSDFKSNTMSDEKVKVKSSADSHKHQNSQIEPWFTFELCCIAWFSVEYLARFISSPSKLHFLFSILNTVDLLAILPYFVILAIRSGGNTAPLSILRVVRLVRVFRIFKLSRHSMSLQVLGNTLQASVKELGMLIFFLGMGVICFSSAIYYAEEGMTDTFVSIPDAFWYTLVTMTTVGYGDKTPTTLVGKLIGGFCALTGVLTLALPVPVIASNFEFFYKQGVLLNEKKKKNESEQFDEESRLIV